MAELKMRHHTGVT